MRGPIIFALSLLTLGGCSALVDFHGLTSTTSTSDAGDAAVIATNDAGGSLDTLDASPNDAGTSDSAADAGARYCTTVTPAPTFCADFDEPGASTGDGWDKVTVQGNAKVALDDAQAFSPPRSLHAITNDGSHAQTEKAFPISSGISIDFDVYYTFLGTGPVSAITLSPAGNSPGIIFFADSTIAYCQVAAAAGEYSMNVYNPTVGHWHHVSIAVTLGLDGSKISCSVDGQSYWDNYAMQSSWGTAETITVQAGMAGTFQQSTADLFVDNVVVRAH